MGKSLRAMHWAESKHPRDDRGRFARKGGSNWFAKVAKEMSAQFGDISMGAHPDHQVRGRLQTGKGHVIDTRAIARTAPLGQHGPAEAPGGRVGRTPAGVTRGDTGVDTSRVGRQAGGMTTAGNAKVDAINDFQKAAQQARAAGLPEGSHLSPGGGLSKPSRTNTGQTASNADGGNFAADTRAGLGAGDQLARETAPRTGRTAAGATPTPASPSGGSTKVYDALLSTDGPMAVQNKSMRQIIEQMEAHDWEITGQNPQMRTTSWRAPDGRHLSVQFINDKKPHIQVSNTYNAPDVTFKKALAHVVTPTHEEVGEPSVRRALERIGAPESVDKAIARKMGIDSGPDDITVEPLHRATRALSGYGGAQTKSHTEVAADLRKAAESNRRIADQNAQYNRGFMSGDGEDARTRLLRERADQFEGVAAELEKMHTERRAYLAERDRRAAAPLDIRPGRSAAAAVPTRTGRTAAGTRVAGVRQTKSTGDAAEILQSATTREEARAALDDMTGAELRDVARKLNRTLAGLSTKDQMKERLVETTVGSRINSDVIRRNAMGPTGRGPAGVVGAPGSGFTEPSRVAEATSTATPVPTPARTRKTPLERLEAQRETLRGRRDMARERRLSSRNSRIQSANESKLNDQIAALDAQIATERENQRVSTARASGALRGATMTEVDAAMRDTPGSHRENEAAWKAGIAERLGLPSDNGEPHFKRDQIQVRGDQLQVGDFISDGQGSGLGFQVAGIEQQPDGTFSVYGPGVVGRSHRRVTPGETIEAWRPGVSDKNLAPLDPAEADLPLLVRRTLEGYGPPGSPDRTEMANRYRERNAAKDAATGGSKVDQLLRERSNVGKARAFGELSAPEIVEAFDRDPAKALDGYVQKYFGRGTRYERQVNVFEMAQANLTSGAWTREQAAEHIREWAKLSRGMEYHRYHVMAADLLDGSAGKRLRERTGSPPGGRGKAEAGGRPGIAEQRLTNLGKARTTKRELRGAELERSTDPGDNGAKVNALQNGTLSSADLFRKKHSGPSGQRANVMVARVRHTPDSPSGEYRIVNRDGELIGWASRTVHDGESTYVFHSENYDGEQRLEGWSDSLATGADVLANGEFNATRGGNNFGASVTQGGFTRYEGRNKSIEELDRDARNGEIRRVRERLANPDLTPGLRSRAEAELARLEAERDGGVDTARVTRDTNGMTAMELADERAARREAAARKRMEALTDEQIRQGLIMRGSTDAALLAEARRRGITGGPTTQGNVGQVPAVTGYAKGREIRPGMLINVADLLPMHESQGNTTGLNPNPRGHAEWVRVGLVGNTNDPAYQSYNSNRSLTGGMYVVFDQAGIPVGRMSANTIAEINDVDVKPEAALHMVRMPVKVQVKVNDGFDKYHMEMQDSYAQVAVPSSHAQQEQGLPAPQMLREGVLDPKDPNYGKGASRPRGEHRPFGERVTGTRTNEQAALDRRSRIDVYAAGEPERAARRAEEEARRRDELRVEREQEAKVAKAKQDERLEQYRRDDITRSHEYLTRALGEPGGEERARDTFRHRNDRGVRLTAEEYGVKTRGKGVTRETMIDGIVEAVKAGQQPDYEIHAPKPELTGDAAAEAEAKKIATADKRRRTTIMQNFDRLKADLHLDEVDPQTNWRGKPDRRADFHYGVVMSDAQIRQLAEAYGLEGLTGQALRDAVFEAIRSGRIPDLDLAPITSLKKKR